MAMSATLNAGHAGSLRKSVTDPSRTRSSRLPAAPPSSSPAGSHTSGRPLWLDDEDQQRDAAPTRRADDQQRAAVREQAEGDARVAHVDEVEDGQQLPPVARARARRARAPWSPGRRRRTAAATPGRAPQRAGPASPPDERHDDAAADLQREDRDDRREVERADAQRQPAEDPQPRLGDVAQEVQHRVERARVRARARRRRRPGW